MGTETIAKSTIGKLYIKALAAGMESRFRYRFFGPLKILRGADILPGQVILEAGCGTGYFTLPAAQLVGKQGCVVALDVLSDSVELVSKKVQTAHLKNVRVVNGNALNTNFEAENFDTVLLFGVIPAPMLPLTQLLPEMHRVLKAEGAWPCGRQFLAGYPIRSFNPSCLLSPANGTACTIFGDVNRGVQLVACDVSAPQSK